MMRYPNGQTYNPGKKKPVKEKNIKASLTSANRGMSLESDINQTNEYYKEKNIALITKRPTPINVVKVDYSKGAIITNAYFEKQSTTDYNGVYKSRYIDFEAKSTKNKTSFPLNNITKHQIEHLKGVIHHGGIAFFIVQFEVHQKVFLIDAKYVIDFYEHGERKSIPFDCFLNEGIEINQGLRPRLDYIKSVDKIYFNN